MTRPVKRPSAPPSSLPEICAWTRDEAGAEWLIPRCSGGAVYGPSGCTCETPLSRIERAEETVRLQAAHIERLRERLTETRDELANTRKLLRDTLRGAATP